MTPIQAFEKFAASLIGMELTRVWRGYGSAIFIEFGALQFASYPNGTRPFAEGEVSLGVEWSWRIEDRNAVLCGSLSEEALWEPAFELLRNSRVSQCEVFGALPEVVIITDRGHRLLSFSTTEGQPRWNMIDRRDRAERWFSVRAGKLHVGDGSEIVE